jgi:hypothetical protein
MSESVRKHRKWLECAAKWRNRRGNILILCPEVVQGGPTNWNERNMRIGRGAAYQRTLSDLDDLNEIEILPGLQVTLHRYVPIPSPLLMFLYIYLITFSP